MVQIWTTGKDGGKNVERSIEVVWIVKTTQNSSQSLSFL